MAEEAVEEEEKEEEECPKCPPVGAPAWMATFADMATLLHLQNLMSQNLSKYLVHLRMLSVFKELYQLLNSLKAQPYYL